MKKNKLALFDLDDTLFNGDTEGEWVKYMIKKGLSKIQSFTQRWINLENIIEKEG